MHRFVRASLAVAALTIAPLVGRADGFETFYVDPSRSFLQVDSGEIGVSLSSTESLFASLTPQTGASQAPLTGEFLAFLTGNPAAPTSFSIGIGDSDVRPLDVNTAAPGLGGGPGTVDAALGMSFLDAGTGASGEFAIHDLVLGLRSFLTVQPNIEGPLGLRGDFNWLIGTGVLEMATNLGIGGTAFVVGRGNGFVWSQETQYAEVSPGVYEVTLPFAFDVQGFDLSGPFDTTHVSVQLSGQVVATTLIPEPGTGSLLALGLLGIGAHRRERSRR